MNLLIVLLIVLTQCVYHHQYDILYGAAGELPTIEPGLDVDVDAGDNLKPPATGSTTFCC